MTDVKDLCDRILDAPAPPLRDSAQVLAAARHADRRRTRLAAGGGLACAALAAAAVAALLPAAPGPAPLAQQTPTAAAVSAVPLPRLPGPDAAHAHGGRIAQVLTGAVPSGYAVRPDGATDTWRLAADAGALPRYVSVTRLVVSDDGGEGSLSAALIGDGGGVPGGDLCAAAVTTRLTAYVELGPATCAVATVGGVAVRTDTAADGGLTATRFLTGGFLTVRWRPGTGDAATAGQPWTAEQGTGRPALRPSAFTGELLARVAADRRLLP
ncbi:hypothetical protein Cs7R123_67020 [Catellatospora sp. TT07R-123]|uniref:hypothetical protein n=1 Tax=Catellatospora sp. TT07R-123 TaxID=2733863 RepID=UPI001B0A048A|nr:hypothetical protein [Catellatospora sp. TT07R-123]GHJ49360.1 hypothetical protein Cs7R123_67020 [Catellatospora sp. TT07R-123]